MQYAFDEFHQLIRALPTQVTEAHPVARYLCALVAELSYYEVPQSEIDTRRRSIVIPCSAYTEIVRKGESTSVVQFLTDMDLGNVFVVVGRRVIAVGFRVNELLFIGIRGTVDLYDCMLNMCVPMVNMQTGSWFEPFTLHTPIIEGDYRVHRGFRNEAKRVAAQIQIRMRASNFGDVKRIFLAGHSLGGAVAALIGMFFERKICSTIMLGAPRYTDAAGHSGPGGSSSTHIRRAGDIVPFLPPRWFGYADHPNQFDTFGKPVLVAARNSGWEHFERCMSLLLRRDFQAHNMESYRRELGCTANAQWYHKPLTAHEKLTGAHLAGR